MGFFEKLNFASSNEDGRSELAALAGPSQRMLCLTGSGTRPLDMLLSEAREVIAIDLNPVQNQLLRLKIAAFEVLDHAEVLAYLGLVPSDDRLGLHHRVRAALPASARAFWAARLRLVRRGVWYAGRWEKVLRFGALGVRAIRGRAIEELFAAQTVQEQAAIWQRRFDDRLWHGAIRALGRPWVWTRVIGEPGGAFLPDPAAVEARLAGAFNRAAGAFLFRESDFASLILRGRNALPGAVPLHLRPENHARIRAALPRLRIVEGGLTDLDRLGIGGVDAFSLSDFGSYTDALAYAACWRAIIGAAAPGALYCERVFMNPLPLPDTRIGLDGALSDRLTAQDRAIIYELRAGQIAGANDG